MKQSAQEAAGQTAIKLTLTIRTYRRLMNKSMSLLTCATMTEGRAAHRGSRWVC
jgi:hypothetical protein